MRIEASMMERVVQRLLITNRIPELIDTLADWCTSDNAAVNLIRMSAHIVICLRTMGLQCHKLRVEEILKSYVQV